MSNIVTVGVVNIMPQADKYEKNIENCFVGLPYQTELVWVRLKNHKYSSTPKNHLKSNYVVFDSAVTKIDKLIITGAPVETYDYSEITYWKELEDIFAYCIRHKIAVLGLCWGGLAVAEILGIEKYNFDKKLFGVFESKDLSLGKLTNTKDLKFYCPQSRFAGIKNNVFENAVNNGTVIPLAFSEDAGYFIFQSKDKLLAAHLGHPEYHKERLVLEYLRDKEKASVNIEPPKNLNCDNPKNLWKKHRNLFFYYWLSESLG